jgi:hypothetical protein
MEAHRFSDGCHEPKRPVPTGRYGLAAHTTDAGLHRSITSIEAGYLAARIRPITASISRRISAVDRA